MVLAIGVVLVYLVVFELQPSADRPVGTRKTGPKSTAIGALKNRKKGFDRSVDRSVELHFGLCFQ
jgi:hypothetical protein